MIRLYRDGDHSALATIFRRAVIELASADYTPQQTRVWAGRGDDPERWRRVCEDGRVTFVAELQGVVSGFINLEADGHIDHFFILPESKGTGIAKALYVALEAEACAKGIERLHVEASEAARRFFEGQAFDCLERRDFALDGVPIHNFAMEKRLL